MLSVLCRDATDVACVRMSTQIERLVLIGGAPWCLVPIGRPHKEDCLVIGPLLGLLNILLACLRKIANITLLLAPFLKGTGTRD